MANVKAVGVGPWGNEHGKAFWEVNGDIRKITVRYGNFVDSLIITYIKDGVEEVSIRFGGAGEGDYEDEISLGDDEHLVTIKGWVNTWQSIKVVSSLTFITNQRPDGIGPFGKESGAEFSLRVNVGKIAGLFGFAGTFLEAIGVSLVPPSQGTVELGPWGGGGGKPWDYNGEVRSFQVASDADVIVSITFNGITFGGRGGQQSETVHLKPGEYLRSIEGATGKRGGVNSVLQTISFVSNEQTYGPYGKAGEGAVPFGPPVKNGKIVGFSGRQGAWIDAIAFKVVPSPE